MLARGMGFVILVAPGEASLKVQACVVVEVCIPDAAPAFIGSKRQWCL